MVLDKKITNYLITFSFFCFLFLCLISSARSTQAQNRDSQDTHPESSTKDKDQNDEKQYLAIFRKLFYSNTYNSLKCHENIYALLKKTETEGLGLTNMKVIFIFNQDHDKLVQTKSSDTVGFSVQRPTITMYKTRVVYNRSDPPGEFRFHVFATYQDKIMDFDYTNSPKLVPAKEYFNNMFSNNKMNRKERKNMFKKMTLRVIPATEYLHNDLQHTSWYLFDLETKFPSQSLNRYLLNLGNKQNTRKPH